MGARVIDTRLPAGFLSRPHSASKPGSSVGQPDFKENVACGQRMPLEARRSFLRRSGDLSAEAREYRSPRSMPFTGHLFCARMSPRH